MLTIWHNPRCRKSRETLALVESSGKSVTLRKYLEDTPSHNEIIDILAQLGFDDPRMLMRRGERLYKDLALKSELSSEILIQTMADHPILRERPIVTNGSQARIGRPPEAVTALF